MSECQCENCGVGYDAEFGTTVDDLEYCQECAIKILKAKVSNFKDTVDKMDEYITNVNDNLALLTSLINDLIGEV